MPHTLQGAVRVCVLKWFFSVKCFESLKNTNGREHAFVKSVADGRVTSCELTLSDKWQRAQAFPPLCENRCSRCISAFRSLKWMYTRICPSFLYIECLVLVYLATALHIYTTQPRTLWGGDLMLVMSCPKKQDTFFYRLSVPLCLVSQN